MDIEKRCNTSEFGGLSVCLDGNLVKAKSHRKL